MAEPGIAAIPRGLTVLVTGVNGFIASHVANEFLKLGYKVRGTVRDTTKHAWVGRFFREKYGNRQFTLVSLPDMTKEDAFDSLVEGVTAVIHVASPLAWSANPNDIIPGSISGALNALRAANREPTVKRFVLTSSSFAVLLPEPDKEGIVVTANSWNNESITLAWRDPPYEQYRAWHVYAASKAQAEQAVWKFYSTSEDRRPDLVVNSVLPSCNFGRSLDVVNQGHPSTSSFVESLWKGTQSERLASIPAQHFVDVQDTARLHVAAAILPHVEGERIYAWAEPFNFDTVLRILRKQNPEKTFMENFHGKHDFSIVEPKARAEELLRDMGQSGFTSLEESILMNTEDLTSRG